ncbi:hypothetical protein PAXRUDRAFT_154601, partial [Paxillus rubicundulus Ve08.2h10]
LNLALQSICKGLKDIPAATTASELVTITLTTVTPCIRAYCPQFPWHECEFMVQDAKWVNLLQHPPTEPYFYLECFHPNSHKNARSAMVFKPKQFSLYIVIPESQWDNIQEFMDKLQLALTLTSTTSKTIKLAMSKKQVVSLFTSTTCQPHPSPPPTATPFTKASSTSEPQPDPCPPFTTMCFGQTETSHILEQLISANLSLLDSKPAKQHHCQLSHGPCQYSWDQHGGRKPSKPHLWQ